VELMDCFDFCLLLLVFMFVFIFDDVRTYHCGVIQASATFNVRLEAEIQICAAFIVPRLALHSTSMMLSEFQLLMYIQPRCCFHCPSWCCTFKRMLQVQMLFQCPWLA